MMILPPTGLNKVKRAPRFRQTGRCAIASCRLLVVMLLILLAAPVVADGLRAELDRDRIAGDETLTLRLIAAGRVTGEPDLQPLEANFEIVSRGQSTRMSIVNGVTSHTQEWTLELAPKRSGKLEIPGLVWGDVSSAPLALEVTDDAGRGGADAASKAVFVESEADRATPYVQQAFQYRVKVLYRQPPQRALLSEPQADGATIERFGDDRAYTELVDGQRYQVVERSFLVVPQQSGSLTIQGPRLEAFLHDVRSPARGAPTDPDAPFDGGLFGGLLGMGGGGRRIVERGSDLEVQVRPQPAGSALPWLPAESLQLTDEWTPSPPLFQVGEVVTRTLTITARGVTAAQLPPLDPGAPDGLQIYPDQPHAEDLPGAAGPAAIKSLKVALVPTRTGRLNLPEVRIPWWDTIADEERVAVVPARIVDVAPAPGDATRGPDAPPQAGRESPATHGGVSSIDEVQPGAAPTMPTYGMGRAFWPGLAGLLGVGWLATLIWVKWGTRRRGSMAPAGAPPDTADSTSTRQLLRRVEQACRAGDARDARAALLAWGRARWPGQTPFGLRDLAGRLGDASAGEALAGIDQAIYAGSGEAWDGTRAWQRLEPRLSAADARAGETGAPVLPELYPQRV